MSNSSVKKLLSISFNKEEFIKRSEQVFTYTESSLLNRSIKSLENIVKTYLPDEFASPQIDNIQDIVNKVIKIANTPHKVIDQYLTIKDLNKISYILFQFNYSPTLFDTALCILTTKWRQQYLKGMLFVLLNYWTELDKINKSKLFQLISNKLKSEYTGKSTNLLKIKDNLDYINIDTGTYLLALKAFKLKCNFTELPNLLGLRITSLAYSYFHEVIFAYIAKLLDQILNNYKQNDYILLINRVQDVLQKTESEYLKKMIIPQIIINADKLHLGNTVVGDQVRALSQTFIGNTSIDSKWSAYDNASEESQKIISNARLILKRWEIQKYLELIFSQWDADKDRQNYWIQKVKYIKDIKLIGAESIKNNFAFIPELKERLNDIFIQTNSKSAKTSALAMHIDDYIFIEFSDVGAIYAYKYDSTFADFYNKKVIDTMRDIKQPDLNILITEYYTELYLQENGRLTHSLGWQQKLNIWFYNVLGMTM